MMADSYLLRVRPKRLPCCLFAAIFLLLAIPPVLAQQEREKTALDAPAVESPKKRPAAQTLPWEDRAPTVAEPMLRPPSGPREILERYEIGPSQLDSLFNGQPLGPGDEDVIVKILFRFPRLGLDNIQRWRKTDVTWDQLSAAPKEYRVEFFPLRGRVKRVEKQELLPELAALYEFTDYYRVTMQLEGAPYQAIICTRRIPAAFEVGKDLDELAAADGLFLKVGDPTAEPPQLIFAARRIAWLPDRESPEHFVGSDQMQLARLGMDIGLFDSVRAGNRKPIGDADREPFYQLLDVLGRAPPSDLRRASSQPADVIPIMKSPEKFHGTFMTVQGTASRIQKVNVSDPDIRRRFGIDHYYEIDFFMPLDKAGVVFGKDTTGEKSPVFNASFPATLNVRRLPSGLEEGEKLRVLIAADAVFFKLWSYRSAYMEKFNQRQPAPMFMAIEPRIVHIEPPANWVTTALVATAFGLALGVIGVVLWWFRRSDKDYEASRRARLAGQNVLSPPDFSDLGAGAKTSPAASSDNRSA